MHEPYRSDLHLTHASRHEALHEVATGRAFHIISPQSNEGAPMGNYKKRAPYFLATLLIALVIGCGQEVVDVPAVTSTVPARGATGVAVNTAISATFSMAMNPATITTATFTVTGPGGAAVTGTVAYAGSVATFTPASVLTYGTAYTATITNGAKSLSANSYNLDSPYQISFVKGLLVGDA
jgi:hypothetical protein